jgi:HK97 family phage major capsid protein
MTLAQLLEARNVAITHCRTIVDEVKGKGGEWSAEDTAKFESAQEDAKSKSSAYLTAKKSNDREQWVLDQEAEGSNHNAPEGSRRSNADNSGTGRERKEGKLITWGRGDNPRHQRNFTPTGVRGSADYEVAYNRFLRGSKTAFDNFDADVPQNLLRADAEDQGGFFIMPEKMAAGIIRAVDDDVFIQARSRLFIVKNARSLGFRKRTAKANSFRKGSELGDITDSLENSLRFGKRALSPHDIVGSFQMSRDLISNAGENMEQIYTDELMIDLSEYMEQLYLFGTGDGECLGYMTPSDEGVSTSRDSRAALTNAFGYADLVAAKYSLKGKYRRNAAWMFHRDYFVTLATMEDTEGHLIWQLSARDDDPDRLLGRPVLESEWMPNTAAADNYYGSFVDYNQFYIAWDAASIQTQRLNEIVARQNMVEYHFRGKVDSMPILEEGFTRLQFAAS